MEISEFQEVIRRTFLEKDRRRGLPATFMWFMEEVGELATALREGTREEQRAEFADVLAWLATLANLAEVELEEASGKFSSGCPGCGKIPCACHHEKP